MPELVTIRCRIVRGGIFTVYDVLEWWEEAGVFRG